MKVLVICPAESIWTKLLIEYTMIPMGWDIYLLADCGSGVFEEYYRKNNIHVIDYSKNGKKGLRKLYPNTFWIKYYIRKLHIDNIILEFTNPGRMYWGWILKQNNNRLLAVAWGSDILTASKNDIRLNSIYYKKSNGIVISTQKMLNRFKEDYGDKYNQLIYRAYFGVNGFDFIKKYIGMKNACCKGLGLPSDKIIISIGYNAREEQQHDKALKCFKTLSNSILEKIHIVLKMTYLQENSDYISNVKKIVSSLGCTYSIFEEYMSNDESAMLPVATDIFVHAQVSDALSASVQEYMYGGALVLNPSWIKYYEFEEMGAFYISYSDFEELSILMGKLLKDNSYKEYNEKLLANQELLPKYYSWTMVQKQWIEIYKKVFL